MKVLFIALIVPALLTMTGCQRNADAPKALEYQSKPATPLARTYRFDILPQYNPAKLAKGYQPLIEYLNARLPKDVQLEIGIPPDFATFERDIANRRADLVLGNPWHVIKAIDAGYQVIAMAGDAEDFRGIFLVRSDSAIRQPLDLKHKTVSYPSPTALAAGMMPQWYLHSHGLDVMHETTSIYVGSQESSIMSVYLKQSDVGATWPPPWRQFQLDYPKEAAQMKVIWETEPLVNNGVVARRDLDPGLCEQLQHLLETMNDSEAGRAVLEGMQTARFHSANDASYAPVRQFVKRFEREVRPAESH